MEKADIALVGLAAAGRGLALNMAGRGYRVAVFDRAQERTDAFATGPAKGCAIDPAKSLQELVENLKTPRRVLLTAGAGDADEWIAAVAPLLDAGDIIMDGGDSNDEDTARRERKLTEKSLRYMGVGIAGSAEDMRNGPCVMPGGAKVAWLAVGRVFTDIAAKADGAACCAWMGPDGAGHFAKSVHDGIQCAGMQLIAESYGLMKELLGMDAEEIQPVFRLWNTGELRSYLLGVACDILGNRDKTSGRPLLELILDETGQAGVERRAGLHALEAGVPAPTLAEAAFARSLSGLKNERMIAARQIAVNAEKPSLNRYAFADDIGRALYASILCAWAQGFSILRAVSAERNWNLKPGEIAKIWRGGSLIRGQALETAAEAFDANPLLTNLMLAPAFRQSLEEAQPSWRRVVSAAALASIPIPCISASLAYFDGYRAETLPANLLAAQDDYLFERAYKRIDQPGEFHTNWEKE